MTESTFEAVLLLAHLYLGQAKTEKAYSLLTALFEIEPNDLRVTKLYCYCLLLMEEYEKALPLTEKLLSVNTIDLSPNQIWDNACILRFQGWVLWGLGRLKESQSVFDSISLT